MDSLEAARRLATLVRETLHGELRDWKAVEHYQAETAFIVLTTIVPDKEYATHRAVLRNVPVEGKENAMLVWGHYYSSDLSSPRARKDYESRVEYA